MREVKGNQPLTLWGSSRPAFGAFFEGCTDAVLIVEADDAEQAAVRVAQVAPLLRVSPEQVMVIAHVDAIPRGSPVFLDAYFEQPDGEDVLSRIGSSTRSIQ
jgi:hypothetical protein